MGILQIRNQKDKEALRVCFFSHSEGLNGGERSLLELVRQLIEDHSVACLVVLPREGPLGSRLEAIGARVLILETSWWCYLKEQLDRLDPQDLVQHQVQSIRCLGLRLAKELKGFDPQIVYTNTITLPWGALAAYFLRVPHIWHVREYGELDHNLVFPQGFQNALDFIQASSDLVIVNSESVKRHLFGPEEKQSIHVIYNYVEGPMLSNTCAEPIFKRPGALKLAISGTCNPLKGQLDAVLALRDLVESGRECELAIQGLFNDESYRLEIFRVLTESALEGQVHFLDFQEDPFVCIYQADIVLVCSRHEAFGRTAVEAMRIGKPVVATRSGGIPEFIQDGINGCLYDPGDVRQLAEILRFLADHPEIRERIAEEGKRRAAERFTRESYGGQIHAQMQGLLREGRCRTSGKAFDDLAAPWLFHALTGMALECESTKAECESVKTECESVKAECESVKAEYTRLSDHTSELESRCDGLDQEIHSIHFVVNKGRRLAKMGIIETSVLGVVRPGCNWKRNVFTESLDLRQNTVLRVTASKLGVGCIRRIQALWPGLRQGRHYDVHIEPDGRSASIIVLDSDRCQNTQVAIILNRRFPLRA